MTAATNRATRIVMIAFLPKRSFLVEWNVSANIPTRTLFRSMLLPPHEISENGFQVVIQTIHLVHGALGLFDERWKVVGEILGFGPLDSHAVFAVVERYGHDIGLVKQYLGQDSDLPSLYDDVVRVAVHEVPYLRNVSRRHCSPLVDQSNIVRHPLDLEQDVRTNDDVVSVFIVELLDEVD